MGYRSGQSSCPCFSCLFWPFWSNRKRGRGGSNTNAAALDGNCEIYGDADGVCSAGPRIVDQAKHIPEIGYQGMQEMTESAAKVLNASCVEFAKEKEIAIFVRHTDGIGSQTLVRKDAPRLPGVVVGVAHEESVSIGSMRGNDPSPVQDFYFGD